MDKSLISSKLFDSLSSTVSWVIVDDDKVEFEVGLLSKNRFDGIPYSFYPVEYWDNYRSLKLKVVLAELNMLKLGSR